MWSQKPAIVEIQFHLFGTFYVSAAKFATKLQIFFGFFISLLAGGLSGG
jgi:hypothetical protein